MSGENGEVSNYCINQGDVSRISHEVTYFKFKA